MSRYWFTDGVVDKLCETCPEGFYKGRSQIKEQKQNKHFTDGIHNVFCKECPEGYWPGITSHTNRKTSNNENKKHFTDGTNNVFCEICPEGFYPGVTIHNKKQTRISKTDLFIQDVDKEKFVTLYNTLSPEGCAKEFNVSRHIIVEAAKKLNVVENENRTKNIQQNKLLQTQQTNLNKYGSIHYRKSKTFLQQLKQKHIDTFGYGLDGNLVTLLNSDCSETFKEFIINKDKAEQFFKDNDHKYTKTELCNLFNCSETTLNNFIYKYRFNNYIKHSQSHYETEIINLFPQVRFIQHYRDKLDGKEIDLYAPDYNVGIEFNGTYWHSSINVSNNYHQQKSLLAERDGIRLIHIYEYEWNSPIKEKIIQLLNICFNVNVNRIYARNCVIKQITNSEAKLLNDKIHLQGHRNAQVTYGLFYKDELVQLMSFSKTKYNKNLKTNNSWEIIRGCPGSNNIVVGGVSKLFKHFINDYNPDEIFSYCDFNKFNGKSYVELGMEYIGLTSPDMKWILKDETVVNRNPSRHKEYQEISIAQIFGAGSKKYIWRKTT